MIRPDKNGARDGLLTAALTVAYGAFALTFRGDRRRFWPRMTVTAAMLGSWALAAQPELRQLRFSGPRVAEGAASAAGLYVVFRVGDAVARRIMPAGAEDIEEVYELRTLEPKGRIAARLALTVGPAEELFWRGFVLTRLTSRHGAAKGAALAALAYGGAHVVTGNPTLVGAATVAGSYWTALAAGGSSMEALIASHVLWDVTIFLVAPTRSAPA